MNAKERRVGRREGGREGGYCLLVRSFTFTKSFIICKSFSIPDTTYVPGIEKLLTLNC